MNPELLRKKDLIDARNTSLVSLKDGLVIPKQLVPLISHLVKNDKISPEILEGGNKEGNDQIEDALKMLKNGEVIKGDELDPQLESDGGSSPTSATPDVSVPGVVSNDKDPNVQKETVLKRYIRYVIDLLRFNRPLFSDIEWEYININFDIPIPKFVLRTARKLRTESTTDLSRSVLHWFYKLLLVLLEELLKCSGITFIIDEARELLISARKQYARIVDTANSLGKYCNKIWITAIDLAAQRADKLAKDARRTGQSALDIAAQRGSKLAEDTRRIGQNMSNNTRQIGYDASQNVLTFGQKSLRELRKAGATFYILSIFMAPYLAYAGIFAGLCWAVWYLYGNVQIPQIKLPAWRIPEYELPSVEWPHLSVPDMPEIKMPKVNMPDVKTPHISIPQVNIPQVNMPKVNMPKVNIPQVNMPQMNMPQVSMPKVSMPHISISQVNMPQVSIPNLPEIDMSFKAWSWNTAVSCVFIFLITALFHNGRLVRQLQLFIRRTWRKVSLAWVKHLAIRFHQIFMDFVRKAFTMIVDFSACMPRYVVQFWRWTGGQGNWFVFYILFVGMLYYVTTLPFAQHLRDFIDNLPCYLVDTYSNLYATNMLGLIIQVFSMPVTWLLRQCCTLCLSNIIATGIIMILLCLPFDLDHRYGNGRLWTFALSSYRFIAEKTKSCSNWLRSKLKWPKMPAWKREVAVERIPPLDLVGSLFRDLFTWVRFKVFETLCLLYTICKAIGTELEHFSQKDIVRAIGAWLFLVSAIAVGVWLALAFCGWCLSCVAGECTGLTGSMTERPRGIAGLFWSLEQSLLNVTKQQSAFLSRSFTQLADVIGNSVSRQEQMNELRNARDDAILASVEHVRSMVEMELKNRETWYGRIFG